MEHDAVPYCDVIPDDRRMSVGHIIAFVMGDVDHAQILNIASVADFDMVDVASHDASEPDTDIFAHIDPSDDIGGGGDPYPLFHLRGVV